MSADPDPGKLTSPACQPLRSRRRRVMHVVRRAHLYLGLFLLPWAVLYGVTGFLFNHPTAFADAPTATFSARELAGTPMAEPPKPAAVAAQVVAALNERAKEGQPYALVEPERARWTRDFAFATVKADGRDVNLLFDVNHPGGTVRVNVAAPPATVEEPAPFAIAPGRVGNAGSGSGPRGPTTRPNPLSLPDPLHERVRAAVPVVLERTGFPTGAVTVTSVPDLSFLMSDGVRMWRVTYNPLTGAVGGTSAEAVARPDELSARRFLTRLHLAHGFPGGTNANWFWAVVVDAMALVMVFWSASGVFMWWQVRAARKFGFLVLLLSGAVATALGFGMHEMFLLSSR